MDGLIAPFAVITFSDGRTVARQLNRGAGRPVQLAGQIPQKMFYEADRIVVFYLDGSARIVKDRRGIQRLVLEPIGQGPDPCLEWPKPTDAWNKPADLALNRDRPEPKYKPGDRVNVVKLRDDDQGQYAWISEFYGRVGTVNKRKVTNKGVIFYMLSFDGKEVDAYFREERLRPDVIEPELTAEQWIEAAKEGQAIAAKALNTPTMDLYLKQVRAKLGPPSEPAKDEHARMADFFFRGRR